MNKKMALVPVYKNDDCIKKQLFLIPKSGGVRSLVRTKFV